MRVFGHSRAVRHRSTERIYRLPKTIGRAGKTSNQQVRTLRQTNFIITEEGFVLNRLSA